MNVSLQIDNDSVVMTLVLLLRLCCCGPRMSANECVSPAEVHFADVEGHVVPSYALQKCTMVTKVTMDDNIEIIGDWSFEGCTSLKTIEWPENLIKIGDRAFSGCKAIEEIILPSKVESIGVFAFFDLPNLKKMSFPETFKSGKVLFSNSGSIVMSVCNDKGTAVYSASEDGKFLFMNNRKVLVYVAATTSTSLSQLPPETQTLEGYSCATSVWTGNVVIPSKITTMGSYLFIYSQTITKVTIGSGVTHIAGSCFTSCFNLAEFAVETGNTRYSSHDGVIYNYQKTNLEFYPNKRVTNELELPYDFTGFGQCPFARRCPVAAFKFSGSDPLKGKYFTISSDKKCLIKSDTILARAVPTIGSDVVYTVPSVTEIGKSAFTQTIVYKLILPSTCTTIRETAFFECNLSYIEMASVTYFENNTFYGATMREITVPDAIEVVPRYFCSPCYNLVKVEFGTNSKVRIIDYEAFACLKATSITLPPNLERIEQLAFKQSCLLRLNLPNESLNYIGVNAFTSAEHLTSVEIPSCVAVVDHLAFSMCPKLENATVLNCATYVAHDAFLSTWRVVKVTCVETRVFTEYYIAMSKILSQTQVSLMGMLIVPMFLQSD